MFRRLADLSRWPILLVFTAAGLMAVGLAYSTLNLFQQGMANLDLIGRHGWLALREGAALQFLGIVGAGFLALVFYFGFKLCEGEISARYRRWAKGSGRPDDPPR